MLRVGALSFYSCRAPGGCALRADVCWQGCQSSIGSCTAFQQITAAAAAAGAGAGAGAGAAAPPQKHKTQQPGTEHNGHPQTTTETTSTTTSTNEGDNGPCDPAIMLQ